jgi:hypothetical protein
VKTTGPDPAAQCPRNRVNRQFHAPRPNALWLSDFTRTPRAEGFIGTDRETGSMMLAVSRAGVFRLGGTLVGTFAYSVYQGELGVRMDYEELAQTGDIDLASFAQLSVAVGDTVEESPADILRALKFDPVPSVTHRQIWKWRQSRSDTLVEFLTPAFGNETVKPLLPRPGARQRGRR